MDISDRGTGKGLDHDFDNARYLSGRSHRCRPPVEQHWMLGDRGRMEVR